MSSSAHQTREGAAHLLLRLGVAIAFLYPPLAALRDPQSWAGYFPSFVDTLPISRIVLLHAFGVLEAVLALWILSGLRIRPAATLATAILIAIVIADFSQIDVLFRDVAIAALTGALALWPKPAPLAPAV